MITQKCRGNVDLPCTAQCMRLKGYIVEAEVTESSETRMQRDCRNRHMQRDECAAGLRTSTCSTAHAQPHKRVTSTFVDDSQPMKMIASL
eukprot:364573-Chlamydomonas_euryale.AAC.1